jgi:hypothetical protein
MVSYNLGTVVGPAGKGIQSITKTGTSGLVDTYTITYTDGTTTTFTVTNGESGADIVTSWESTPSNSKVASEKLTKDTLDTKASNSHTHGNISNDGKIGSSSGKIIVTGTSGLLGASDIKTINNNSLLGSGNIDIQGGGGVDIVTSWSSTLSDTKVPSEKLTKNTIDTKLTGTKVTSWSSTLSDSNIPSEKLVKTTINNLNIPTKISDLTNDSDFIETSSTSGLIKNDGTVMTSGTGSTNYAAGNHTHSGYVSATKVTSWSSTTSDSNVPSEKLVKDTIDALEDLIGDAIDYINL